MGNQTNNLLFFSVLSFGLKKTHILHVGNLIMQRDTEINYKLLLDKFSIQMILTDQQEPKFYQNNNIKCYSIILNILNICLEFSTFNRIVESLPSIIEILKWSIMQYSNYLFICFQLSFDALSFQKSNTKMERRESCRAL